MSVVAPTCAEPRGEEDSTSAHAAAGVTAGIVVFGLALAVRLTWVLTLDNTLTWVDEQQFIDIARHLATGDGYVSDSFRANPVLPGYLAVMLRVFGERWVYARIGQAVLGAATCVLVLRIATLAAGRRVGIVGGVLSALYLPHVYLSGVFYVDVLLTFLSAVAVYLAMRAMDTGRAGLALACGLSLGLTVLTRAVYVVFVPCVYTLWLLRGRTDLRGTVGRSAALTLGLAVTILPWTARNYRVYGRFVLVSSGFGTKLWEGNNPLTWGDADDRDLRWGTAKWQQRLAQLPERERAAVVREYDDVARRAQARIARLGDDTLVYDDLLLPIAMRYIAEHPARTAALFVTKLGTLYSAFTRTLTTNQDTSRRNMVLSALAFYPVLALALVGAVMGLAGGRRLGMVVVLITSISLTYSMLDTCTRFRLPLDPFLIVLASLPLAWLWERAARGVGV